MSLAGGARLSFDELLDKIPTEIEHNGKKLPFVLMYGGQLEEEGLWLAGYMMPAGGIAFEKGGGTQREAVENLWRSKSGFDFVSRVD
jgi:hypothetical protein